MDIWHYNLLFNLLVIHVMLPFSRSDLNVLALGPDLLRSMQPKVNDAYFISAFGYIGMILGGSLWRIHLGKGFRKVFRWVIEYPSKGSLLLLRSRILLLIHGIIAICLLVGVLAYYFKTVGFGFNLRGLLLVLPALRPVAQFAAFYSVLIASYCLVRFVLFKERSMLIIVICILCGLLFYGERGNLAAVFAMTIVVSLIKLRRRFKPVWLLVGGCGALLLALFLDVLRTPEYSFGTILAGSVVAICYGNSFSDTRDFAVILSQWDGHYLLGKTYVAGLIAFVPRFLSNFRDTWALGVVTATTAGFSATEHPGLRVGIFGEAYLNCGLTGVLILSLFVGATIRLVDIRMKSCAALLPPSDLRIYSYYVILLVVGVAENSTNMATLYSVFVVFGLSWLMQEGVSRIRL